MGFGPAPSSRLNDMQPAIVFGVYFDLEVGREAHRIKADFGWGGGAAWLDQHRRKVFGWLVGDAGLDPIARQSRLSCWLTRLAIACRSKALPGQNDLSSGLICPWPIRFCSASRCGQPSCLQSQTKRSLWQRCMAAVIGSPLWPSCSMLRV